MEIQRTGIEFTLPHPVYESVKIASAVSRDGEKFTITVGLDKKMAEELKQRSLDVTDTEVQNKTSDRRRFGEGSYEAWYAKDRTPFALIHDETQSLAGLIWLGPEVPKGGDATIHWHTLAYRSYNPFRGKGLMKAFTKFALDEYARARPNIRLWTAIHSDNVASIGLSKAIGLEIDDALTKEAGESVIMVRN